MGSEALSKEIYEFPEVAGIFMKLELVPNVQCFRATSYASSLLDHSISRTYTTS